MFISFSAFQYGHSYFAKLSKTLVVRRSPAHGWLQICSHIETLLAILFWFHQEFVVQQHSNAHASCIDVLIAKNITLLCECGLYYLEVHIVNLIWFLKVNFFWLDVRFAAFSSFVKSRTFRAHDNVFVMPDYEVSSGRCSVCNISLINCFIMD